MFKGLVFENINVYFLSEQFFGLSNNDFDSNIFLFIHSYFISSIIYLSINRIWYCWMMSSFYLMEKEALYYLLYKL